jgi:hypothetical protein
VVRTSNPQTDKNPKPDREPAKIDILRSHPRPQLIIYPANEKTTNTLVWPLKEIVDRLLRLSLLIRKAATPNRNRRIEEFVKDNEDYYALSDAFKRCNIRRLEDRYPMIDEQTLKFLVASIAWRWKRFMYLQSRKKQAISSPRKELPPRFLVEPMLPLPKTVNQSQPFLPQDKAHPPKLSKSELLTEHTATTFQQEISKSETNSTRPSMIPTVSVVQEKDFHLPPRPKGPICPYCFDVLLEEELNEDVCWRLVVFHLADYTHLTCI